MTITLLRRSSTTLRSLVVNSRFVSIVASYCSRASNNVVEENERPATSRSDTSRISLSPLLSNKGPHVSEYNIELVDDDTWQISAGLAHAWRGLEEDMEAKPDANVVDGSDAASFEGDSDFDEIDNMRIRGDLFYKLDRNSKEYEEYSFDFHRRKTSQTKEDNKESEKKEASKTKSDIKECQKKEALKRKSDVKESKKKERPSLNLASADEEFNKLVIGDCVSNMEKRVRTPTFNQLTAPYHEPFCLDIYISKASVRACIVHRVTSKVVVVAHSISKDLKFDLDSTRNATACAAVGGILAQRALADDVYDVVYTPRRGEKLEGKLLIVLQAIIDHGVNVKVKLKQRKPKKGSYRPDA